MLSTPFRQQIKNIGLFQLIRKGWDTIPEVMAAGALGTASLIYCWSQVIIHYPNEPMKCKRYKMQYTVYRPDDPRAEPVLHPNPNFKWPDYPEPKVPKI